MQSVYLIAENKPEVSTPKNQKHDPDEFMIALLKTKKFKFDNSLLEWKVVKKSKKKKAKKFIPFEEHVEKNSQAQQWMDQRREQRVDKHFCI